MKILKEKQYAAFAANAKTLDSLRRNEVSYVPGVFEVTKVIVLCKEDFEKLSEDVSPEYPFLKDNRKFMSADPGSFCWHCVLVKGENSRDGILVDAEGYSYARYAAFAPDCDKLRLQDIPVHYEYPARAPEQKKSRKRKEPER